MDDQIIRLPVMTHHPILEKFKALSAMEGAFLVSAIWELRTEALLVAEGAGIEPVYELHCGTRSLGLGGPGVPYHRLLTPYLNAI